MSPDLTLLSGLVAALSVWAGLVTWIMGRMLDGVRQDLAARLSAFEEKVRQVEADQLRLRAELPVQYVRKEDAIRSESVLHAKLDALYAKIEQLQAKG
jgi:seryl-tRNA(Sec) selenium transferase